MSDVFGSKNLTSSVDLDHTLHCLYVAFLAVHDILGSFLNDTSEFGDFMVLPIELLWVGYHQFNIGLEVYHRIILVTLTFVFHVFKSNWLFDKIPIVGGVLACWLILEQVWFFQLPKFIEDLQKGIVQALLTVLLLSSSALVAGQVLILVVIFGEAVIFKIFSVWRIFAIATTIFSTERRILLLRDEV